MTEDISKDMSGDKAGNRITDRAAHIAAPLTEAAGCELVAVEYLTENGRKVLRLLIDKPEGVGIEDCTLVSQAVEKVIDAADLISGAYDFEVSSPGSDRPLRSDRDLERNRGRLVDVLLNVDFDGRNSFEGFLRSYDEQTISVELDEPFVKGRRPKNNGKLMNFSREDIKIIRRAIRF